VQTGDREKLEHNFIEKKLTRVFDKLLDKIQRYHAIEEMIARETSAHYHLFHLHNLNYNSLYINSCLDNRVKITSSRKSPGQLLNNG
jgi:hypothetical protein